MDRRTFIKNGLMLPLLPIGDILNSSFIGSHPHLEAGINFCLYYMAQKDIKITTVKGKDGPSSGVCYLLTEEEAKKPLEIIMEEYITCLRSFCDSMKDAGITEVREPTLEDILKETAEGYTEFYSLTKAGFTLNLSIHPEYQGAVDLDGTIIPSKAYNFFILEP